MSEIIKRYIDKAIAFAQKHKEYLMCSSDVSSKILAEFDLNLISEKAKMQ